MALKELVLSYRDVKTEHDRLKKELDRLNTQLKDEMAKDGLSSYTEGNYTVYMSNYVKSSFNADALLKVLDVDSLQHLGLIVTKKIVDMDALESALYRGDIPSEVIEQIQKCRISKKVTMLTGKIKKED